MADQTPEKRPVGRPRIHPIKPPRVPSEPTGRYVECTQNRHTHEPRLVPVMKGPIKHHWCCTCTAHGYMSKSWKSHQGYTLEQALELAKLHGWQVIGH